MRAETRGEGGPQAYSQSTAATMSFGVEAVLQP